MIKIEDIRKLQQEFPDKVKFLPNEPNENFTIEVKNQKHSNIGFTMTDYSEKNIEGVIKFEDIRYCMFGFYGDFVKGYIEFKTDRRCSQKKIRENISKHLVINDVGSDREEVINDIVSSCSNKKLLFEFGERKKFNRSVSESVSVTLKDIEDKSLSVIVTLKDIEDKIKNGAKMKDLLEMETNGLLLSNHQGIKWLLKEKKKEDRKREKHKKWIVRW